MDEQDRLVRSYLVSGRSGMPNVGVYRVYSKSRYASSGSARMEFMVRFAHGRNLAIGFHSIPTAGGRPLQTIAQLGGRYVDTLERIEGKWLIVDRKCIREWSHSHPIAGDWLANAGFVGQHRGQADASYGALGLSHAGNPWLALPTAAE